ncbi:EamA family transporter [uncultured Victivallis sp.]|uniref:DMT family transporter n=1 Tax=uncultured Victivallis sp. TaxID=354118 RepID=UPI0025E208BF|nr:EamA family transporter [uncultured Victivallis sp.]
MNKDTFKGLCCGVFAAVAYGMNPLFTLPLYRTGMTPDSVLFHRYALAMILLGLFLVWRKKSFRLSGRQLILAVIGGLLMALSSLFLFLSYKKMDAGIASTILFVYPVMVAVIMATFFREKISVPTILGIVGALAGVGILYRGDGENSLNISGLVLVLLSALSYALYMVAVRETDLKRLSPELLTFYALVFGVPLFGIRLKFGADLQWPATLSGWGCAIALAFFPTIVSLLLMTVSIRLIGATRTAILGALEPITAVFFGILLFGEQLTLRLVLGILVILAAVTVVISGSQLSCRLSGVGKRFHLCRRQR